ncbi:MAG: hypothetical protein ABSB58_02880 [Gemmatimonadales bacterium]|jgi:hypothetical protein
MNLLAGWTSILLGFVAGAVPGLFFWREEWLGGYASWRRRMIRLAHIAFFGLGFINLLFALTVAQIGLQTGAGLLRWSALLLLAGNVAMPAVCYLAAWRQPFRQLFPVPVTCMILGVGFLVKEMVQR